MKNKLILILGLLNWGLGIYMLVATKTECGLGALTGAAIGSAAGTGAGLAIGGIGVAACGTGVGIPVGVVCLGLAAVSGTGGAALGGLLGETTTAMFPRELSITVLLLGCAIAIWGLFRILKERRKKAKQ